MIFVWTLDSVIAAVFIGGFLLLFGFIGVLIAIDKAQKWLRRLRP